MGTAAGSRSSGTMIPPIRRQARKSPFAAAIVASGRRRPAIARPRAEKARAPRTSAARTTIGDVSGPGRQPSPNATTTSSAACRLTVTATAIAFAETMPPRGSGEPASRLRTP
jgi:hypothetical protein